ncbi:hypothetical protein CQR47_1661 [Bifidobacterium thermophilum]|uniref:Uncharacterized protein n=1 Tax=Bifidobacterium thermophilum TaxID=33905 RepID=A0A2N3QF89_9BIFI|nr:hypothetical protein CQR47_1661 [Bifidobacterium thermophilum]
MPNWFPWKFLASLLSQFSPSYHHALTDSCRIAHIIVFDFEYSPIVAVGRIATVAVDQVSNGFDE